MAKLNKKTADRVNNTEGGSFEPLEDGAYHARLRDVDSSKSGKKGPYWSWEFEVAEAPYENRRLWNNTSLSEAADFKMKETFEAFGVPADTDTDELIGNYVKLIVSTRTIQEGSRKGEPANQIDRVKPPDEEFMSTVEAKEKEKAEQIF